MASGVKRIISGEVDFNALRREQMIPISTDDQSSLIDIKLSLFTLPGFKVGFLDRDLLGVEDLRMYISGKNVTSQLIAELKRLIGEIPAEVISQQYLLGAGAYISFVKQMRIDRHDTKGDEEFASEYAADKDWVTKFNTLGSRQIGHAGNLHPLSFLYRFIAIPGISIQAIWDLYQASVGQPKNPIANLNPLVITFSQGPSPSFEEFNPKKFTPGGRLSYQLELSFQNPLDASLRQIASQLRTYSLQLDTIRTKYTDDISNNLNTLSHDTRQGLQALSEGLSRLQKVVEQIKE